MWKHVDTVIYYISDDFKFYPTIAIFSFIGTIIKKVEFSKELPSDNIKIKYAFDELLLKEKMESINTNVSIIIYDSFNTNNLNSIKYAFEKFQKSMNCPMVAFFSTVRNKYSKPFTGMWKIMELFYKKQNKIINKPTSLVIGNRAGRITIKRDKKDKDCYDRAFAHNIGISFVIPEKFFLNDNKLHLWSWDVTVLNKLSRQKIIARNIISPIILDEINLLPKSNTYTIIIIGNPSCGKTTFAKKIKRKWDADYKMDVIELITDDIITKLSDTLGANRSVLIDGNVCITNAIKTSMEKMTPILIIDIVTDEYVSQLIDFMKVQSTNSILRPKNYISQFYKPYYKKICYKEKYANIQCVRYVEFPLILNSCEELWYEYAY